MQKGWGGKRKGAGRKPGWKHGPCKAVKLPADLVDDILHYAHQLDAGQAPLPPSPAGEVPSEEPQPAGWAQVKQLVEEKQALNKRVLYLEETLAKERRKSSYRDQELERLKQAMRYASLVLADGIADHEKGIRRGFSVKDARHALNALQFELK